MNRLLEIGFEQVGKWLILNQKLALELSRMNAQRNVLYAFIQDGSVMYVGKTTGSLENRMAGYLRPHATQRTNIRNNRFLMELLLQDKSIDIYAWADTGIHRIGAFHLNYAAGLEDSIIRTVLPPWNGARTVQQTGVEPSPQSDSATVNDNASTAPSNAVQEDAEAAPSEVQALETAGIIKASPMFEVVLGKTYFHNGFFNVPVKFSEHFPEHGTEISIYCGSARTLVRATVDRKANQSNRTPRIYGRSALAGWFQQHKQLDAVMQIRIVSAHEIELI